MTTEQWLETKLQQYKQNPQQTLEEILLSTTEIIDQYNSKNIESVYLLESCLEHNKLFLIKSGILL